MSLVALWTTVTVQFSFSSKRIQACQQWASTHHHGVLPESGIPEPSVAPRRQPGCKAGTRGATLECHQTHVQWVQAVSLVGLTLFTASCSFKWAGNGNCDDSVAFGSVQLACLQLLLGRLFRHLRRDAQKAILRQPFLQSDVSLRVPTVADDDCCETWRWSCGCSARKASISAFSSPRIVSAMALPSMMVAGIDIEFRMYGMVSCDDL